MTRMENNSNRRWKRRRTQSLEVIPEECEIDEQVSAVKSVPTSKVLDIEFEFSPMFVAQAVKRVKENQSNDLEVSTLPQKSLFKTSGKHKSRQSGCLKNAYASLAQTIKF